MREVLIRRRITRVPDACFPVLGVLSLRGEMVTVFDLVGLQAAVDRAAEEPDGSETTGVTTGSIRPNRVEAVVVLRGGRDSVGLVVDGVEDIRDFSPGARAVAGEAPRSAPVTGPLSTAPAPGRLWAGTVEDERGEIGILDVDAAFESAMEVAERPSPGRGPAIPIELAENGGREPGPPQNGTSMPADHGAGERGAS